MSREDMVKLQSSFIDLFSEIKTAVFEGVKIKIAEEKDEKTVMGMLKALEVVDKELDEYTAYAKSFDFGTTKDN